MQRQKLQQAKKLQQDVHVVHQLKDLQDEELLAGKLQENLLAGKLQEELLAGKLQENLLADELQEDLPHEEGDVNLLSFFLFKFS
jgi:hypothetical protein